jgi:hypothetical protein
MTGWLFMFRSELAQASIWREVATAPVDRCNGVESDRDLLLKNPVMERCYSGWLS